MTTINKLLLGASVLGACYLTSCEDKNTAISKETIVNTLKDSTNTTKYAQAGNISLEPTEFTWNNTKLIGKDEGFINRMIKGTASSDGNYGAVYVYSTYLFKNPIGEEVVLFGREDVLFVGENYNISFYRLKPGIKLTSKMILEALENDVNPWVNYNKNMSSDLEGVLNKYTRVKK